MFGLDTFTHASWLAALFHVAEWGIRLVLAAIVLRRRFEPTVALAWLCVIFLVPELGLFLYLLLGAPRLGQRRLKRYEQTRARVRTRLADRAAPRQFITKPNVDPVHEPMIALAQRIGGMPIVGGSNVELLTDTEVTIDRLVADIDKAERHVHLLFYIYRPDATGRRVADALIRASKRGVWCRLLADSAGSPELFRSNGLADTLREADVNVVPLLPVSLPRVLLRRIDVRNHRKLAVIDGCIGYTGSQNVVDASYGRGRSAGWHDMMGRFTGPIVAMLQQVFVEDLSCDSDDEPDLDDLFPPLDQTGPVLAQVIPTVPQDGLGLGVAQVMLAALTTAQKRVIITTPYLVPDEPTLSALVTAAARGVDVDIVVPARSDHRIVGAAGRFYFEQLLNAGVSIHLHRAGLLHSKTMTVDDAFALLGSTNMDIRSFYLNYELNVLMYGPQVTQQLRQEQLVYLNESEPVTAEQWSNRPVWKRYAHSVAALFSPLL